MRKLIFIALVSILAFAGCKNEGNKSESSSSTEKQTETPTSTAAAKTSFRVAWSHYTGWEPWGYAQQSGILKMWAEKEGIEIELTLVNDYIESINLYTSGEFDACTMTNMDALTIPAVGGVDSEAVIIGDFSNGNDGIVMKDGSSVADLKGRTVNLVELSVSHYLLARALDMNGLAESDIKLVNTSDADIASLFLSQDGGAAVTWNPPLMQTLEAPGAKLVFDSSGIPGEIIDIMVVKTEAPDSLKRALVGAWYETIALMEAGNAEALEFMAKNAGASLAEFNQQLKTTSMFYTPKSGAEFAASPAVKTTMDKVRQFSFDKGLYGGNAKSADLVGIEFNDGSVLGDAKNIKLRFTARHMQAAAAN